ncbi:UDP-glucose/GDP-mannose dehydrogenase family protein [PVC group bacterium]|nr:UDP-glucose/GDP-mannose dehydrogenase family protein [PVC group bacterium]
MKITIIGTGYVGLVTGTCLASMGNDVICVDHDEGKINELIQGGMPIYEPGLKELIERNRNEGRLEFSTDIKTSIQDSLVVFICVQTPPLPDGGADLTYIEKVSREIAENLNGYKVIVEKSTVPVKTCEWVFKTIKESLKSSCSFDVASNPEFLCEGSAVKDFLNPDRIIIGVESEKAKKILTDLYSPFQKKIFTTDIRSAEMIKHASNSFLATKISFANALANICELSGADVKEVVQGMGFDPRIGTKFFGVGIGYGGECFPKDVAAFRRIAKDLGYDFGLLSEVEKINKNQRTMFCKKIEDALGDLNGKKIGIWGLAYKPNTDDMRNAPSIDVIKFLLKRGARIKAYDPEAIEKARSIFPDLTYVHNPYEAARDCDVLVILTEWPEFKGLDLHRIKRELKNPLVIDGRNIYEPFQMEEHQLQYISIGRKTNFEKMKVRL